MTQVCDHPALLSDRATQLVTSGGHKLAAKQKERKACLSLGGFITDNSDSESSEGSWSSSNSGSDKQPEDEEVPVSPFYCFQQQPRRPFW